MSPLSLTVTAHLTLLTVLSATTIYLFYKSRRLKQLRLPSLKPNPKNPSPTRRGKLFYISQTGTSKALAQRLLNLLASNNFQFDLIDPKDYEPEDLNKETIVLIVASTWEDGNPPPNGGFFANWLAESAEDFRVGSLLLSECKFAVFGVGSRSYGETFNAVAREFSKRMRSLGGAEVLPVCEGDVDGGQLDEEFDVWSKNVVRVLKAGLEGNDSYFDNVSDSEIVDEYNDDEEDKEDDVEESEIVDLEDIAGKGPSRNFVVVKKVNGKLNGEKEMVTPVIRASLTKQVI